MVASHYTQDQFNSEALLIKYSNLLFDIKNAVKDIYDIDILRNIDDFPFVDRREEEYYQAVRELSKSLSYNSAGLKNTYYIVKKVRRKFGLFEYVLSPANDKRTIDECSMAENEVVDYIINHNHFKKMLLVGDERQIESIKFGNWFGISNKIFQSKFELTFNHRTTKPNLRLMWDLVRDLDEQDKIYEKFISGGFHHELDEHIFDKQSDDEIILCLNYDGLYGINNINKYLQRKNKGISVSWKVWTFKVGDRILFNESYYFRDYFYNNQKGRIENIKEFEDKVIFLVSINHESTNNRNSVSHVEWLQEKDNKDYYEITIDKDDDDDEEENSKKVLVVPFQLGYAISIHKSQGLEYDSVKVVMTKEVEEQISHNIFYTAITRAKEHLSIYCDKTSLEHIIKSFQKQTCEKDAIIIKRKYGL